MINSTARLVACFAVASAAIGFSSAASAVPVKVLDDGSTIALSHPEAAVGPDGRIHVVAQGSDPTSGLDTCGSVACDIYYMQVRKDGTVLIAPSKVNSSASGTHGRPRVAVLSDNRAVVTWASSNEPLRYALVDPSLNTNPVGSAMSASALVQAEFTLGAATSGDSHASVVDSNGIVHVVQAKNDLYYIAFNPATHTVVNAETIISTLGAREPAPAIGIDSNDNIHIAFDADSIDGNAPAGYMMIDNTGAVLIAPTALYDGSLGAIFPHGSHFSLMVDGDRHVRIVYGDKRNTPDAASWCNVCDSGGTMFYVTLDPSRAPQNGTASDMATLRVGKEMEIGNLWYGRAFLMGGGVQFFAGQKGKGALTHATLNRAGGFASGLKTFPDTNLQASSYYDRNYVTGAGNKIIWAEGVFLTPLLQGTLQLVMADPSGFSTSSSSGGGGVPPATLLLLGLAALAKRRRFRAD